MIFRGKNRKDVKRKALSYWASNADNLGLSLRGFLICCRMDTAETTIVFTPHSSSGATGAL
jgi:hypothetical protein